MPVKIFIIKSITEKEIISEMDAIDGAELRTPKKNYTDEELSKMVVGARLKVDGDRDELLLQEKGRSNWTVLRKLK